MSINSVFSNEDLTDWWSQGKTIDEFLIEMGNSGITDSASGIADAVRTMSGGQYSFTENEVSSWINQNPVYIDLLSSSQVLPDWTYDYSGFTGNKLQADSLLKDYYGQMANSYLPSLDAFAQQNAGQMVAFDPNRLMSIEDFGLSAHRGDLRNVDLLKSSHDISTPTGDDAVAPYYYLDDKGRYQAAWNTSELQGKELFSLTQEYDQDPLYTSVGNFHKETPQEAVARLLAQGGGYKTGLEGTVSRDFMGEQTLNNLTTEADKKWGNDYVNMPELKPYLDDPAWVTKTDGKVTAVRAELLPLMLRESIGEEYRGLARGSTKESDFIGDLVKMALLGTVTGGMGLAGASALGLGTAAAGAGMGATMAGMGTAGLATAGAIGGGLSAGLTGNDILKGALTGGVLGGVGGIAKGYAPGISDSIGLSNVVGDKLGTNIISGGIKGAASGALKGDVLSGAIGGMVNPAFKGAIGLGADALFSGNGNSLPTDEQLAELQFTNPDAYDWYMFGDQMGNLDQTDYSWMVGNGEQTGYTGTAQGDTQMGWLDNLFSSGGILGDDTQSFIDSLAIDTMSDGDALDWLANYDEFAPGADYSFNDNILDYFDTDGNNLLGSGSTMPDWFGNYDPLVSDPNVTGLISNLNPDYSFNGLIQPGAGELGSTLVGGASSPGVLGSVRDAVQGLLGGGAAGAANSSLIYALLQALMKSKQTDVGNRMNADSVNMVINSGEKGAPNRLGTNFGMTKTAVGSAPPLGTPVSNGVFQLGLTRN